MTKETKIVAATRPHPTAKDAYPVSERTRLPAPLAALIASDRLRGG